MRQWIEHLSRTRLMGTVCIHVWIREREPFNWMVSRIGRLAMSDGDIDKPVYNCPARSRLCGKGPRLTSPAPRKYKHPPIAEAVCEFVFPTNDDWDPTISGRLFEQVKGDYPARPRPVQTLQAQIAGPSGLRIRMQQPFARVRFADPDDTKFIEIGANSLSVHTSVQPYLGWEETFLPQVERAIEAFSRLETSSAVGRVGVRYVNRIAGVSDIASARTFVKSLPPHLAGLPKQASTFFSRIEYSEDDGAKLLLTTAKADLPEPSLILDIDVLKESIDPLLTLSEALTLLGSLKRRLTDTFETVITNKARKLFDAD